MATTGIGIRTDRNSATTSLRLRALGAVAGASLLAAAGFVGVTTLDGSGPEAAPAVNVPAPAETAIASPSKHTFYVVATSEQRDSLLARLREHQELRRSLDEAPGTFDVVVIPPDASLAAWQPIFGAQAALYEQGITSAVVDMRQEVR